MLVGDISSSQLSAGYWLHGLDLLGISKKYLTPIDLYSEAREVTKERTLAVATERKKKGVKTT